MILIDTGPLVALCDRHDALHKLAVTHLERLKHNPLGVSTATLTEACFHLTGPAQRARLRQLLAILSIAPIEAQLHDTIWMDVFDWLEKYADQEPDFADACLAVLCGLDSRTRIWTYDREFSTIWRKPDGSPIPLAVEDD